MAALTTQAANVLNLYLWAVLKKNTLMDTGDYGGKVPIIPAAQEPDFTQFTAPFIVYGFSEDPSTYNGAIRGGTLAYAIYSSSNNDLNQILNVIIGALSEDDTARRINKWSSLYNPGAPTPAFPLLGIRFTDVRIAFGEGASPPDQEGGRKMATMLIKYEFVAKYTVDLNV